MDQQERVLGALTPADFRHLLQAEATGLSRINPNHLDQDVPHLDGWTVRSVLGHTGWVFRFADLALQADPADPPSRSSVPEPPPGADVIVDHPTAVLDQL